MPSLTHHEHLAHSYTETSDADLLAYWLELTALRNNTEIPRQQTEIDKLLGRLTFEIASREGVYGSICEN